MGNIGCHINIIKIIDSEHEWREREKEVKRADTLAVLEGAVEGEQYKCQYKVGQKK